MSVNTTDISQEVIKKAKSWLTDPFDSKTQQEVKRLIDVGGDELVDSFYKDLEFGTGGLRGLMGVGTNRMNSFTISKATQGLSNYLLQQFPSGEIKVAIAYDSRNNSKEFAHRTAEVFAGNGFKVYLFESLRPTPELSFTIRELGCKSGVVITASHNPKEYNGYKAYWEDGGQVIAPHDKNIITEVNKITSAAQIKISSNNIEIIGEKMDVIYINKIKELSLSPELIQKEKELKIVYTPIHGTGGKIMPMALKAIGFNNITLIEKQLEPNGDFPTVVSPNPEESAALDLALRKGKEIDADLIMGTDPDSDRIGIAVKDPSGNFVLLNGNQTAAILIYYLLYKSKEKGLLSGKEYIAKTIVTSDILTDIGNSFKVKTYETLTGFKYIAELIGKLEGKERFIGGGEESYGYLIGEFVRDKDAIASGCIIAEAAAWSKSEGKSLFDILLDIYQKHGLYVEHLVSITKKGKKGADEIRLMMEKLRSNPPSQLSGLEITSICDYQNSTELNLKDKSKTPILLPKSDVLQFKLKNGGWVTARPSGTEPKIKFYFSLNTNLKNKQDYSLAKQKLDQKIEQLISEFNY